MLVFVFIQIELVMEKDFVSQDSIAKEDVVVVDLHIVIY